MADGILVIITPGTLVTISGTIPGIPTGMPTGIIPGGDMGGTMHGTLAPGTGLGISDGAWVVIPGITLAIGMATSLEATIPTGILITAPVRAATSVPALLAVGQDLLLTATDVRV